MNALARHALTAFILLFALVTLGSFGLVVFYWPKQTLMFAAATIATVIVGVVLFVVYRLIYKALDGVKISRSK